MRGGARASALVRGSSNGNVNHHQSTHMTPLEFGKGCKGAQNTRTFALPCFAQNRNFLLCLDSIQNDGYCDIKVPVFWGLLDDLAPLPQTGTLNLIFGWATCRQISHFHRHKRVAGMPPRYARRHAAFWFWLLPCHFVLSPRPLPAAALPRQSKTQRHAAVMNTISTGKLETGRFASSDCCTH